MKQARNEKTCAKPVRESCLAALRDRDTTASGALCRTGSLKFRGLLFRVMREGLGQF